MIDIILTEDSYKAQMWVDHKPIELPLRIWANKHYIKGDSATTTAQRVALGLARLAPEPWAILSFCILANETPIAGWVVWPGDLAEQAVPSK